MHLWRRNRDKKKPLRRPKMMKLIGTTLVLFAASTLPVASAYGQTHLKANVPFAFKASSKATMPAGVYEVILMKNNGGASIVHLRNAETSHSALVLAHS